ncbi:MAG: signal peptidase I [Lachnospiraceae bacterium]|nr:signal peptidase I [Lachnospiraceae bacterium]
MRRKKKSIGKVIRNWVILIAVLCLAVYTGLYIWSQRTQVSGSSMYPSLSDGDILLVDRVGYHLLAPRRFDLVIFPSRYNEGTSYIRRIIALPGETIQIMNGDIYVNGTLLEDPHENQKITQPGRASELITLGQDEFFVLCDNAGASGDSREPTIGNVKRSEIRGRIWMRIWPLMSMRLF